MLLLLVGGRGTRGGREGRDLDEGRALYDGSEYGSGVLVLHAGTTM